MLNRCRAREHSLAGGLRSRHARLSAGLLQRGLFDRRDEHLAFAQTSLLEEALSQSANRLRELGGFDNLRIDAAELVFALLLDQTSWMARFLNTAASHARRSEAQPR
jgi:hypothetical protein